MLEQRSPASRRAGTRISWATKGLRVGNRPAAAPGRARRARRRNTPAGRVVRTDIRRARSAPACRPRSRSLRPDPRRLPPRLARRISNQSVFEPTRPNDIVGVEVGGAVKNVLAIAAGMSDGLRLRREFKRIALISARPQRDDATGCRARRARQKRSWGCRAWAISMLTCTDDQSRNRRMGLALADRPGGPTRLRREIGQVVEGVYAARRPCIEVADPRRRGHADLRHRSTEFCTRARRPRRRRRPR